MRALDVGHRPGVKVEPLLTEDGVPAPADKLVDHYQGPNREMVDFRVHKSSPIIKAPGVRLQGDSSADRAPSNPHPPLSLAKGEATYWITESITPLISRSVQIWFGKWKCVLDQFETWFRVVCNDDFHDIESEKNVGIVEHT